MKTTTILTAEKFEPAAKDHFKRGQELLNQFDDAQEVEDNFTLEGIKNQWRAAKDKFENDPLNAEPVKPWDDFLAEQQTRLQLHNRLVHQRLQKPLNSWCIELLDATSDTLKKALSRREKRLMDEAQAYGLPTPTPDGLSLALASQIGQIEDAKKLIEKRTALEDVMPFKHISFPPLPSVCGEYLAGITTKRGHRFAVCSHTPLSAEPMGVLRENALPAIIAEPLRKVRRALGQDASPNEILGATLAASEIGKTI